MVKKNLAGILVGALVLSSCGSLAMHQVAKDSAMEDAKARLKLMEIETDLQEIASDVKDAYIRTKYFLENGYNKSELNEEGWVENFEVFLNPLERYGKNTELFASSLLKKDDISTFDGFKENSTKYLNMSKEEIEDSLKYDGLRSSILMLSEIWKKISENWRPRKSLKQNVRIISFFHAGRSGPLAFFAKKKSLNEVQILSEFFENISNKLKEKEEKELKTINENIQLTIKKVLPSSGQEKESLQEAKNRILSALKLRKIEGQLKKIGNSLVKKLNGTYLFSWNFSKDHSAQFQSEEADSQFLIKLLNRPVEKRDFLVWRKAFVESLDYGLSKRKQSKFALFFNAIRMFLDKNKKLISFWEKFKKKESWKKEVYYKLDLGSKYIPSYFGSLAKNEDYFGKFFISFDYSEEFNKISTEVVEQLEKDQKEIQKIGKELQELN